MGSIKTENPGLFNISYKLEWVTDAFGNKVRTLKEPKEIDSVKFDIILSVPNDLDATEFILSGPEGAMLEKVGGGFKLSEGVASYVEETSP
ncbi:MAG: hypothetical protein R6U57_03765 [Anaerolineales bacterium]